MDTDKSVLHPNEKRYIEERLKFDDDRTRQKLKVKRQKKEKEKMVSSP
ncbi:hypothetical protein SAMD00079811_78280 (plasmid) [Scytonema sp. HK-05]|nr:hypothetical protein [Scytonema sp. HK-05]BAY50199.1 hypothetical protein SAMD00079811_78280 [Scytonema sp. HK-05]